MRKYDAKNKRNIGIIIGISVVIFAIFSFFVYKVITTSRVNYTIATASVFFDADKNQIKTEEEATLKIKWSNNYYLDYQEEDITLGSNPIIYNEESAKLSLYGKYYEVTKDAAVNTIEDENIINPLVETKFYKVADRKYLLVSDTIKSLDANFSTSNYLIVELDKKGNATLTNNKVNYKTFSPTTLITSAYTFDIANEILKFAELEIDLKKIIGSTNEYTIDDLTPKNDDNDNQTTNNDNNQTTDSNNSTNNQNGSANNNNSNSGTNNSNSSGTTNNNENTNQSSQTNESNKEDDNVEELINASTKTSIIRVIPSINKITVDYVVYDPNNEYKNLYVEITDQTTGTTNISYLSKNNTNLEINNLTPNTKYKLTFKYTYLDENNEANTYTYDESTVTTKTPSMTLKLTNITSSTIGYQINLDSTYSISSATVSLQKNNTVLKTTNLTSLGTTDTIKGAFDIQEFSLNKEDIITVKLTNLNFNGTSFDTDIYYKFKY